MKEVFLRSLCTVALAVGVSLPALADTIRLKDGSVLHGQVIGFKDQQFTILLGSGARGRKSRITVYMEDVDSIEFWNLRFVAAAVALRHTAGAFAAIFSARRNHSSARGLRALL